MNNDEIDITVTRESGTGRQYLRFSQTKFNEHGVETSRKNGFKELSKGADPAKALEWAKSQKWRFGTQNRQNGQYEVLADGVLAEQTAGSDVEHADA